MYLQIAQGTSHSREALVEADKGFATLRLCEMERVGEIHPVSRPIQCLGSQGRVLQRDPRQTGKGGESSNDPLAAEPISPSQHPFGFEQHGCADVNVLAADRAFAFANCSASSRVR